MKVHLVKKQSVEKYSARHARSWTSFNNWITAVKFADWETPEDIMKTFGAADLLGNGTSRVVFDIGGNNFRMICKYVFGDKQVHLFVCWMGSHREYDGLCKKNEQYTINNY